MKRLMLFWGSLLLSATLSWSAGTRFNGDVTIEGVLNACDASGATNTYTCNLNPTLEGVAYRAKDCFEFVANAANTGAATINFNGVGAATIKKMTGAVTTDLIANDIRAGQIVRVCYDGTNMQMQSQLGNAAAGTGTVTATAGALTPNAVMLGAGTTDSKVMASLGGSGEVLTSQGAGGPPIWQAVAPGGTGITGATNHGLMVATSLTTGTSLGVATNGQLAIGSTGADPVLASLGGTANRLSVTPGPGSIALNVPDNAQLHVAKLVNLNTTGFVKTSGVDGTLSVDGTTYLTANQTISISGDVSGSGTTAITTTLATVTVPKGGTGLTSGTSGGIPYFNATSTMLSSAALGANLPVIGGGAGLAPSVGSRSGNTTAFVTLFGAATSGRCAQWDVNGNLTATGSACGSATGLGDPGADGIVVRNGVGTTINRTIVSGNALQITVASGDGVSGNPSLTIPASAQLSVAKLTNLITNGFVKTSGSDGTLSIDGATYLTAAVTNIATTAPLTGGPITTTGTIACASCVTSAAALVANAFVTGGGLQATQTVALTGLVQGKGASAPTAITDSTTVDQVLRVTGANTYGWGPLNLAGGAAAVTGQLPNSNTTAVSANTINTIVLRDGSGNFTATTITANLTGTASIAATGDSATAFFSTGQIEAARGGTNADSSASTGIAHVATGVWTFSPIVTADITDAQVTLAKMANMATASFLGRNTAATGVPEVLSIATAKTMLGLTGTNSGDQTITLGGDLSGSGTGSITAAVLNIPAGVTVAGSLTWADGFKQTFNPNGTNAGVNVGAQAGNPSSLANGDLWYNATLNELTARINGVNVALGAGGVSGTITSGTVSNATYYTGATTVAGSSGFTYDGTSVLTEKTHCTLVTNADVTLGTHRCVYMSTGNTNRIANLPASADGVNARVYEVYKTDAGTGTVTLHPSTTNTLNGVNADVSITNRYEGWRIVEESATGWIVGTGIIGPLSVAQGGTGLITATGLLQGTGTTAMTTITNSVTVGQVLRVTASNAYGWGALDLADGDAITNDLPYANLTPATAASKLLGRGSASGAGDWQEITLGAGLTMTGTTLSSAAGGGDFSSNTATSVDSEVVLFSGTLGKTGKRATGTGIATLAAGVLGTVAAPTGAIVGAGQANTWTTGAQDMSLATSFTIPVSAGKTTATNGFIGYDSSNHMLHAAQNGADAKVPQFTVTPANNDCVKWTVSGANYKLDTAAAPCGSSGGVTDADKGDINVTGGGTVWTIDPGVVTAAKLATSLQAGYIKLWPGQVTLPDGTTNNAFAQAQVAKSATAPPTNGSNVFFTELLFDGGATDEHAIFCSTMPPDYVSGGTLYINWKRASGTGVANVVWKGAVSAVTPGGTEVPNNKAFNTVTTTTTAAGTTSLALQQTTIVLNMDSAAARDMVCYMVGRDSSNASDTLDAVDAQVTNIWVEYVR